VKLSTRPDKRVGTDEAWDHAEGIMQDVLKRIEAQSHNRRIKTAINPGEGAFYGPKFEYVLRDAIGRDWQCGTTQVDFNLPERFDAFYIAADGSKKAPVMIHRAICGSMERFLGILLENYAGHLPLWLAPVQAIVTTITSDSDDYAAEVTGGGAAARSAGGERSAQREDQLQGPRALAGEGAGDAGGRQEGSRRASGFDPPARQGRPAGDAARRGAQGADRRGGAAGFAKDEGRGVRRKAAYRANTSISPSTPGITVRSCW
jgi:hypothetical protein